MSHYEHQQDDQLDDPARAGWIHLLPSLEGKQVLKVGAERGDNIRALLSTGCASLTVVGSAPDGDSTAARLHWCPSIDRLSGTSYDAILFDEEDQWHGAGSIRHLVTRWSGTLNPGGVMLVCLPAGTSLSRLRLRWGLGRLSRERSGLRLSTWFSLPDSSLPLALVPDDGGGASDPLMHQLDRASPPPLHRRLIAWARQLFGRIVGRFNPFCGLVVVAQVLAGPEGEETGSTIAELAAGSLMDGSGAERALHLGKRFVAKQNILYYRRDSLRLQRVAKVVNLGRHRSDSIRQEHLGLTILHQNQEALVTAGVQAPEPLLCRRTGRTEYSLETALGGVSLEQTIAACRTRGEEEPVIRMAQRLVETRIRLQPLFQRLAGNLPRLDERYFDVVAPECDCGSAASHRARSYRQNVEHGDYSDVNILLDPQVEEIGLIDWEWFQAGFPPLFDLFFLFTSFGYLEDRHSVQGEFPKYRQSFIDTYFRENRFSRTLADLVRRYGEAVGLPLSAVPACFHDYLTVTCNKYRMDYNLPQFVDLYRGLIAFSHQNGSSFQGDGNG